MPAARREQALREGRAPRRRRQAPRPGPAEAGARRPRSPGRSREACCPATAASRPPWRAAGVGSTSWPADRGRASPRAPRPAAREPAREDATTAASGPTEPVLERMRAAGEAPGASWPARSEQVRRPEGARTRARCSAVWCESGWNERGGAWGFRQRRAAPTLFGEQPTGQARDLHLEAILPGSLNALLVISRTYAIGDGQGGRTLDCPRSEVSIIGDPLDPREPTSPQGQ